LETFNLFTNNLISGKAAMLLSIVQFNLGKSIRDKIRRENYQERRAEPPNCRLTSYLESIFLTAQLRLVQPYADRRAPPPRLNKTLSLSPTPIIKAWFHLSAC